MNQTLGVAVLVVLSIFVGWWIGRTTALDGGTRAIEKRLEQQAEEQSRHAAEQLRLLREQTQLSRELVTHVKSAQERAAAAASSGTASPAPRVTDISTEGAPSLGPAAAPVTIVEFSDFECPPCASLSRVLHRVSEHYPERVRIVFKHNPLPSHRLALRAHRAATAAQKQGRFWEMSTMIFGNQNKLSPENLREYARVVELNLDQFEEDMESDDIIGRVAQDITEAKRIGVTSVPSFFINGRKLEGFQPYDLMLVEVQTELTRKAGE